MKSTSGKRNLICHTLDGILYLGGIAFTSQEIVLSVLIHSLGGSPAAVGSVFALTEMGGSLTQLVSAPFVDTMKTKKWYVMLFGILHRLPWLALAILLFLGYSSNDGRYVPMVLILMTIAFLFGGFLAPGWSSFLAATVKSTLRGRLFAVRQAVGGAIGIAAGFAVTAIIHGIGFPQNFSLLFLLTFVFLSISLFSLAFVHEPEHQVRSHESLKHYYISHIPNIIKEDSDLRCFILVKAFMLLSLISFGFFSVYGLERFELDNEAAGTFTTLFMIGHIGCSFLFGWIADRFGHRVNIVLFALLTIVQSMIALFTNDIYVYSVVFLLLGGNRSIQYITFMTMPLEYAESGDRPTYYALSQSITSPLYLIGIAGGFLVPSIGYAGLFDLSMLFSVFIIIVALRYLKEPRYHRPVLT